MDPQVRLAAVQGPFGQADLAARERLVRAMMADRVSWPTPQ
jgi:hypothetical protein